MRREEGVWGVLPEPPPGVLDPSLFLSALVFPRRGSQISAPIGAGWKLVGVVCLLGSIRYAEGEGINALPASVSRDWGKEAGKPREEVFFGDGRRLFLKRSASGWDGQYVQHR